MHRNQMEHGMSAQTATQAMAEICLAMGDAVEPLLQVIRSEINRGPRTPGAAGEAVEWTAPMIIEDDEPTQGDRP